MEAVYYGETHWFRLLVPDGGDPVGFSKATEVVESTAEAGALLHHTDVTCVHPWKAVVLWVESKLLFLMNMLIILHLIWLSQTVK